MGNNYDIQRNSKALTGADIESLRDAVNWPRNVGQYDQILKKSYSHYSVQHGGCLIGFLNVISDGIGNAFLVDLMVHPDFQQQGLGRAMVETAIRDLTSDGIQQIQTTFHPESESFYRRCGFHILKAGVIDTTERAEK